MRQVKATLAVLLTVTALAACGGGGGGGPSLDTTSPPGNMSQNPPTPQPTPPDPNPTPPNNEPTAEELAAQEEARRQARIAAIREYNENVADALTPWKFLGALGAGYLDPHMQAANYGYGMANLLGALLNRSILMDESAPNDPPAGQVNVPEFPQTISDNRRVRVFINETSIADEWHKDAMVTVLNDHIEELQPIVTAEIAEQDPREEIVRLANGNEDYDIVSNSWSGSGHGNLDEYRDGTARGWQGGEPGNPTLVAFAGPLDCCTDRRFRHHFADADGQGDDIQYLRANLVFVGTTLGNTIETGGENSRTLFVESGFQQSFVRVLVHEGFGHFRYENVLLHYCQEIGEWCALGTHDSNSRSTVQMAGLLAIIKARFPEKPLTWVLTRALYTANPDVVPHHWVSWNGHPISSTATPIALKTEYANDLPPTTRDAETCPFAIVERRRFEGRRLHNDLTNSDTSGIGNSWQEAYEACAIGEYTGWGVLDFRAATEPLDTPSGNTAGGTTLTAMSLARSNLSARHGLGVAYRNLARTRTVALHDSTGAPFHHAMPDAPTTSRRGVDRIRERWLEPWRTETAPHDRGVRTAFRAADPDGLFGSADGVVTLTYGDESTAWSGTAALSTDPGARTTELSVRRAARLWSLAVGLSHETDAVLDSRATGTLGDWGGVTPHAAIGLHHRLGGWDHRWHLRVAAPQDRAPGGLVTGLHGIAAHGWEWRAERAVGPDRRIGLHLRQPMRVHAGTMTLHLPDPAGSPWAPNWHRVDASAAPDGRELQLGVTYRGRAGGTAWRVGASAIREPGHDAGADSEGILFGQWRLEW